MWLRKSISYALLQCRRRGACLSITYINILEYRMHADLQRCTMKLVHTKAATALYNANKYHGNASIVRCTIEFQGKANRLRILANFAFESIYVNGGCRSPVQLHRNCSWRSLNCKRSCKRANDNNRLAIRNRNDESVRRALYYIQTNIHTNCMRFVSRIRARWSSDVSLF